MPRGRWLGWALGALLLAGAPRCGGEADRERGPEGASGGDGGSQLESVVNAGAVSTVGVGGGPSATGGNGGFEPDWACPALIGQLQCGRNVIVARAEPRDSSCEVWVDSEMGLGSAPLLAVDCEYVPRFTPSEGGAAGWPGDQEQWSWDQDTSTATFMGSLCEQIEDGVSRVDFLFNCAGPS